MNASSIALVDLKSGEYTNLTGNIPNSKFLRRGHKMYNNGVLGLVDILTKEEIKRTINIFDFLDYNNILVGSFLNATKDMSKAARSRYKSKLLENKIMQEYNNKLMFNPFTFVPKGDKNIPNSQYLTQRVWEYMFIDINISSESIIEHAERLFGKLPTSDNFRVGSKTNSKLVSDPKSCK